MVDVYKVAERYLRKPASILPKLAGSMRASVAFIHMPKCGGTSLHSAISRHYRPDAVTYLDPMDSRSVAEHSGKEMLPYRRSLLAYELAKGAGPRFASGHWPVDDDLIQQNSEHWSFVTILRDPVERWLSNYFFNRHRSHLRDHFGTELDLEDYLDTSEAIENGKLYLSFCHGGKVPEDELTQPIAHAIDVLNQFAIVGKLEAMPTFADEFEELWGIRPKLPNTNANPASEAEQNESLTPELLARVRTICEPDIAIYNAIHA